MYGEKRYRSGQGLAVATLVLLASTCTNQLLAETLGQFVEPTNLMGMALIALTAILQFLTYIATVVLFLVWLNRAHHNMAVRGSGSLTMSPGMAVGGWFIPFYNLVHGYRSMLVLWTDTEPTELTDMRSAPTPMLGLWWAAYLLSGVSVTIVGFNNAGQAKDYGILSGIQTLLYLTSAVLFGMLIWRIQRRQAAQNGDLSQLGISGDQLAIPSLT